MGLENLRSAVKRALAAGAAALLATAAGAAAGTEVAGREVALEEAGLPVVVRLPEGYDPGRPWPLVVFLHGAGECGSDGRQAQVGLGPAVAARPDRWPCLVLMPQKPSREHQWEAYEDQVLAAIAEARARWNIDGDRIALTGLSQGGHGTWTFAANHPGTWAAIAPVCGYLNRVSAPPELDASYAKLAEKIKHLPVWAFHGEDDKVVKVEATKAVVDSLKAAGADVRASYYPGVGHDSWTNAYREKLGEWFLRHTRKP